MYRLNRITTHYISFSNTTFDVYFIENKSFYGKDVEGSKVFATKAQHLPQTYSCD